MLARQLGVDGSIGLFRPSPWQLRQAPFASGLLAWDAWLDDLPLDAGCLCPIARSRPGNRQCLDRSARWQCRAWWGVCGHLFVGLQRGFDVFCVLPGNHGHMVDFRKAGLIAHNAMTPNAHGDFALCGCGSPGLASCAWARVTADSPTRAATPHCRMDKFGGDFECVFMDLAKMTAKENTRFKTNIRPRLYRTQ